MTEPKPRRRRRPSLDVLLLVLVATVVALSAVPLLLGDDGPSDPERQAALSAFHHLSRVATAQERHHARHARYAARLDDLDAPLAPPPGFRAEPLEVPPDAVAFTNGWSLTLVRQAAPTYSVTWDHDGWDAGRSSVPADLCPLDPP